MGEVPEIVGDGDVTAAAAVSPNVAAVATPFSSTVRWTGSVIPKLAQPRLSNELLSRAAMNVNRLSPTVGSAGGWPVNKAWFRWRLAT